MVYDRHRSCSARPQTRIVQNALRTETRPEGVLQRKQRPPRRPMAFGAVFVRAISTDNISIPVFIRVNENDGYKIPHERRSVYQKYATKGHYI